MTEDERLQALIAALQHDGGDVEEDRNREGGLLVAILTGWLMSRFVAGERKRVLSEFVDCTVSNVQDEEAIEKAPGRGVH